MLILLINPRYYLFNSDLDVESKNVDIQSYNANAN